MYYNITQEKFNNQSDLNTILEWVDTKLELCYNKNKNERKNMIIYPDYYYKFKCIANKCKHNCCIGWEIDIDEQTMNKYFKTNGFLGKKLKENTSYDNNTYHFVLSNNERCPFLNDNNLCEIIETLGEDMLCQICSDHPRFRNYFDNRTEIGLGICCEHAAEIILTNKNKVQLTSDEKININDSFYKIRESIFDTLQNRNIKLQQRIENMLNQFPARLTKRL